jgi:DNA-binding HxlR family transcriptional regulator
VLTQYCPIEVAAEIVAERWNLLIIRDLTGPGRAASTTSTAAC